MRLPTGRRTSTNATSRLPVLLRLYPRGIPQALPSALKYAFGYSTLLPLNIVSLLLIGVYRFPPLVNSTSSSIRHLTMDHADLFLVLHHPHRRIRSQPVPPKSSTFEIIARSNALYGMTSSPTSAHFSVLSS